MTVPAGILFLIAGLIAGRLTRRLDPRLPWLTGLGLLLAGVVALAWLHKGAAQIVPLTAVQYVGAGMALSCSPLLLMGVVDKNVQGVASGMQLTVVNLMNTVTTQVMFTGLAVGGTVLHGTALYRESGYRAAYLVVGAFVAVALLISLLLPKISPTSEITAGPALV